MAKLLTKLFVIFVIVGPITSLLIYCFVKAWPRVKPFAFRLKELAGEMCSFQVR